MLFLSRLFVRGCFSLLSIALISQETCAYSFFSFGGQQNSFARVDTSSATCVEESEYIAARSGRVSSALKELIGPSRKIKREPIVSFCLSGGSYCSMVGSLGFLEGAEETGLIDVASYVASTSGGTWCVANLLMRMMREGITLSEFHHILMHRASLSFLDPKTFNIKGLCNKVITLLAKRGKIEPLDLWGMLLSDHLFGDLVDAHHISFEDIRDLLREGELNFPYPLFSVVFSDVFPSTGRFNLPIGGLNPHEWVDVSPFDVRSGYLGGSVATLAFDSPFSNGYCYGLLPERGLGWFCALFGSTYNFSLGNALIKLTEMELEGWGAERWLVSLLENVVDKFNLNEMRLLSSSINNFMWELPGATFSDQQRIKLSDASMSCNLPLHAVLDNDRSSDVILVLDASSGASMQEYSDLRCAAEYAKRKGLKFPSLDSPKKISDHLLLFEDESDPEVPVIFYIANPNRSFMRMTYKFHEFETVCGAVKEVVVRNKKAIVSAIRRKATRD